MWLKPKKSYINLKEAARISGYSSDYIGYLIRKGEIKGKRIYSNAAWRVSPKEIIEYCRRVKNLDIRDHPFLKKKYLSLRDAAQISGYSPDYLGYLIRKRKISGKKIYSSICWLTSEEEIRKYKEKRTPRVSKTPLISTRNFHFPFKIPKYATIFIILGIIIFSGLVAWGITSYSQVQTVEIYPAQVAGDWQNPENVKNQPEVGPEADFSSFSEANSAVYKGSSLSLVLSGFNKTQTDLENEVKEKQKSEQQQLEEQPAEQPKTENQQTEVSPTLEEPALEIPSTATESTTSPIETTTQPEETIKEEQILPEEEPTSFFEKVKNLFGNLIAKAQEIPTFAQLQNFQIQSAKIKFSFAIGEKKTEFSPLLETPSPEETPPEIPPTESVSQPEEGIAPIEIPTENTTPNEEGIQPLTEPEKKETPVQPEEIPQEESSPASFWQKIKNFFGTFIVNAQEEISPIETVTPPQEGIVESTENAENGSLPIETTTPPAEGTQEVLPNLDAKIIIWYSLDGENWQKLDEISNYPLSNFLNGGYFSYDAPFLKNWDDVKNLKIKFEGVAGGQTNFVAYLDSVWLEVNYQEIEEEKFELRAIKRDWRADEEPEFELVNINEKEKGLTEKLLGKVSSTFEKPTEPEIKAELIEPEGEALSLNKGKDFSTETHSPTKIKIFKNRSFQPGLHKLKISFEKNGKTYELEQEFTWGVLAINTNKSIYLPGETAYLQMAALKEDGHTICDANLKLEIISPSGQNSSPEIQKSNECGPDNVTDTPDYFVYYQVGEAGIYEMKLTNLDNGYEISDSFEVRDSVPFDIERIGPTRIYPPVSYEMTLKIKANQDFAGEVIEQVPASFEVISHETTQIRTQNNTKEIIWEVDWKIGETYELKYQFDAPDVSPYLYLLGPLEIGQFKEIRQWQIASDAPSTPGTTTSSTATYTSTQRLSFYYNGRHWVFYTDGTNFGWRTSTDGTTWTGFTTITAETLGRKFSVFFDGSSVHYARSDETATNTLFYRKGTPNSDGTITWSTERSAIPKVFEDDAGNQRTQLNLGKVLLTGSIYRFGNTSGGTSEDYTTEVNIGSNTDGYFVFSPYTTVTTKVDSLPTTIQLKGWQYADGSGGTAGTRRPIWALDGRFPFAYKVRDPTTLSHAGNLCARLWTSPNIDMSSATALTSWTCVAVSLTGTTLNETVTGTINLDINNAVGNAFAIEGKYFYIELIWDITTPATNARVQVEGDYQQSNLKPATNYIYYPNIAIDSAGYPWIGFARHNGIYGYPYIAKGNATDGTWSFRSSSYRKLSTLYGSGYPTGSAWPTTPIPLTGGKVYVIFVRSIDGTGRYGTVYGQLWNGSSWLGSDETPTSRTLQHSNGYSATNEDDDVYMAFNESTTLDIYLIKRTYSSSSWSEVKVESGTTTTSYPVLSWQTTGKLKVFWAEKLTAPRREYIYYKTVTNMTPDASATVWIDEVTGLETTAAQDGDEATWDIGAGTYRYLSQSFKAYATATRAKVNLYLKRCAGTADDPIAVTIYAADANGIPTGDQVADTTIASFTSTSYAWYTATINASLTGGTNYAVIIDGVLDDASNYYCWGVDVSSPTFTDGNFAYQVGAGSWTADNSKDALFEIFIDDYLNDSDKLSSFYKAYSNNIGLVYMTKTTSPYNVRFANYALIDISGNAYEDEGTTKLTACNGTISMIALRFAGTTYGPIVCSATDGSFTFSSIDPPSAGTPMFFWVDGATCGGNNVNGSCATTLIRYSGSLSDAKLRRSRLIVRHDDSGPVTNANLGLWDNADDPDIVYDVDASNNLTVEDNIKLIVNSGDTFTPGATVTTSPSSDSSTTDGDVLIESGATLNMSTNSLSIGGDYTNSGTFIITKNQTTTFTATGTGFSIAPGTGNPSANGNFAKVIFNGTGGEWTLSAAATLYGDLTMTAGTLKGAQDITVKEGFVSATAGTINLTGGTFTLDCTSDFLCYSIQQGNFSNSTDWTFYNLTFTTHASATTFDAGEAGKVTVTNVLTITGVATLSAGSDKTWILSGSGTPFARNGKFNCATSTFNYTGTAATTVTATTYYNLGVGTTADDATAVTYTLGGNTTVQSILTIGNASSTATDTLAGSSYILTLSGSGTPFNITSKGAFSADTSTVKYTASDATNVTAATYNNLELLPSANTITFTLGTGTGQTITTNNLTIGNGTNTGTINADTNDPTLDVNGNFTISANATFIASATGTFTVAGNWSNSGTFTHSNGTVTFDASSGDKTISDGGSCFYNIVFNSGASWTYQDSGCSDGPNQTTVQAGTVLYLNAKTGTVSVTGGTLNVDWYLGVHVVDAATLENIDTGDNDITISENSATPQPTVWRHNGTDWGTPASSQTTGTDSSGKTPQPPNAGAIRIREYSMTNSSQCPGTGCTLYKYNLQIAEIDGYGAYDYYLQY